MYQALLPLFISFGRWSLGTRLVDSDFEVGMVEGLSVINIRTQDDVKEFWLEAKKVGKWCCGVMPWKTAIKRATSELHLMIQTLRMIIGAVNQKRDGQVTGRNKENQVQETIEALQKTTYTIMQLRIWYVQSGIHSSYTDPPKFQRAGGKDTPKRKSSETMAETAAHVASQAVASNLTPKASSSAGTSPGRDIESCSKCYRQLSELNNLKAS